MAKAPATSTDLFVYVADSTSVDPLYLPPGKMLPIASVVDAGRAYSRECRSRGLRTHEAPDCFIVDGDRRAVGRVGVNGRVFAVKPDGYVDYATRLA